MGLDLSRAGGMSRLLRQGKASEHIIDWTGLRCVIMPFLTRYKRSLAVAVAHSGTSPHVPTYRQAKRAASECDYACFGAQRTQPSGPARSSVTIHHWRGDYLARRTADTASRAVSGPPYAALRSAKSARSRPPAAAFGLRRQLSTGAVELLWTTKAPDGSTRKSCARIRAQPVDG